MGHKKLGIRSLPSTASPSSTMAPPDEGLPQSASWPPIGAATLQVPKQNQDCKSRLPCASPTRHANQFLVQHSPVTCGFHPSEGAAMNHETAPTSSTGIACRSQWDPSEMLRRLLLVNAARGHLDAAAFYGAALSMLLHKKVSAEPRPAELSMELEEPSPTVHDLRLPEGLLVAVDAEPNSVPPEAPVVHRFRNRTARSRAL